jgi:hypothetical protein
MTHRAALLLKAIIRSGAVADLFAQPVQVAGHARGAAYVAPYTAIRHTAPPRNSLASPPPAPLSSPPAEIPAAKDSATMPKAAPAPAPLPSVPGLSVREDEAGNVLIPWPGDDDAATIRDMTPGKWDRERRAYVINKRSRGKAAEALAVIAARRGEDAEKVRTAADAENAARAAAAAADAALPPMASTANVALTYLPDRSVVVRFPYSDAGVRAVKQIEGARWNQERRAWVVPERSRPALRAALPRLEQIGAEAAAFDAAQKAEREARQAKEREEAEAERIAAFERDPWMGMPIRRAPEPGAVVRLGQDRMVVVTRLGRKFPITENTPSVMGHTFLGEEGGWGVQVHYRPATPEEVAGYEARLAAAKARNVAKADMEAAITRHAWEAGAPAPGTTREGLAPLATIGVPGYSHNAMLAPDGALVVFRNDSDWDTDPVRVPPEAAAPLIHRIRAAQAVMGDSPTP